MKLFNPQTYALNAFENFQLLSIFTKNIKLEIKNIEIIIIITNNMAFQPFDSFKITPSFQSDFFLKHSQVVHAINGGVTPLVLPL